MLCRSFLFFFMSFHNISFKSKSIEALSFNRTSRLSEAQVSSNRPRRTSIQYTSPTENSEYMARIAELLPKYSKQETSIESSFSFISRKRLCAMEQLINRIQSPESKFPFKTQKRDHKNYLWSFTGINRVINDGTITRFH